MTHDTDEVFAAVENGFSDIDLDNPIESVIARGRRLRDRRRARTGLATMGVAAVAALAVALPSSGGPSTSSHNVNVDMAGWSVHTAADSKVTLTVQDLADPDQLRKVLAQAGITAHIRVEKASPGAPLACAPPSYKDYVPESTRDIPLSVTVSGGTYVATIDPVLMPKGAVFSLILFDEGSRIGFASALFTHDAPVTCVAAPNVKSTGSNPAVPGRG
jgi:hypothetical protein